MMGDEDELSIVVFDRFFRCQEPRLYFPQSDEVIRLIDKDRV